MTNKAIAQKSEALSDVQSQKIRDLERALWERFESMTLAEGLAFLNLKVLSLKDLGPWFREAIQKFAEQTQEHTLDHCEILLDAGIAFLKNLEIPKMDWFWAAIPNVELRALLSPILQEILLNFVQKYGAFKMSKGLFKSFKVGERGKRLLGQLGLDQKIKSWIEQFSNRAAEDLKTLLQKRIHSQEGQILIKSMLVKMLRVLSKRPLKIFYRDLRTLKVLWALSIDVEGLLKSTNLGEMRIQDFLQQWDREQLVEKWIKHSLHQVLQVCV